MEFKIKNENDRLGICLSNIEYFSDDISAYYILEKLRRGKTVLFYSNSDECFRFIPMGKKFRVEKIS